MDRSEKEKVLSNLIMYPSQIDIMSSLSGRSQGLPFKQIVETRQEIHGQAEPDTQTVEHFLDVLMKENLVKRVEDRFSLTSEGVEILKIIGDVADKAKEKSLI